VPIFDYRCENGHVWCEIRGFYDDKSANPCPDCGEPGERILSIPGRPIVKRGTPMHHGAKR